MLYAEHVRVVPILPASGHARGMHSRSGAGVGSMLHSSRDDPHYLFLEHNDDDHHG